MWKIKAKIGISKCSRKHEYCNKYKNLTKKLFGHYKYFLASTLVLVCSRKWQCSYRGNVMDDATFSPDSVTIRGKKEPLKRACWPSGQVQHFICKQLIFQTLWAIFPAAKCNLIKRGQDPSSFLSNSLPFHSVITKEFISQTFPGQNTGHSSTYKVNQSLHFNK